MQNRLSTIIRIAVLAVSLLILIYSIHVLQNMKHSEAGKIIHCRSAFDSQVNSSRLHAAVILYLYREKGSLQIIGDYISPAGVTVPVKLIAGVVYQADGQDYHVRFTGLKNSLGKEAISDDFPYLLPFTVTSENVDYLYQLQQQDEGSYLIRQDDIPLVLCKKISAK